MASRQSENALPQVFAMFEQQAEKHDDQTGQNADCHAFQNQLITETVETFKRFVYRCVPHDALLSCAEARSCRRLWKKAQSGTK